MSLDLAALLLSLSLTLSLSYRAQEPSSRDLGSRDSRNPGHAVLVVRNAPTTTPAPCPSHPLLVTSAPVEPENVPALHGVQTAAPAGRERSEGAEGGQTSPRARPALVTLVAKLRGSRDMSLDLAPTSDSDD